MIVSITHNGLSKSISVASSKAGVVTLEGNNNQTTQSSYRVSASQPGVVTLLSQVPSNQNTVSVSSDQTPDLCVTAPNMSNLILRHGVDGINGTDGQDGVGIQSIQEDSQTGTLTFSYTDGDVFTTSNLKGDTGATGPQGLQGEPGPQGPAGQGGSATPSGASGAIQISGGTSLESNDNLHWHGDDRYLRLGIDRTPREALDVEGNLNLETISTRVSNSFNVTEATVSGNLPRYNSYIWYIQYEDEYGNRTSASQRSKLYAFTALGNGQADPNDRAALLQIGVHPNPRVVKRRIFRTKVGGTGASYLVAEIPDNTTTTYIDTKSDAQLGTEKGYRLLNETGGQITVDGEPAMTLGSFVTSLGKNAGSKNTSAVIIGSNASSNGTGDGVTVIGYNAARNATTGKNMTIVGATAGLRIADNSQDCSFYGTYSGREMITGRYNSLYGFESGRLVQGGYHINAFGYKALKGVSGSSATRCTGIGSNVYSNYSSLDFCTGIGYNIGTSLYSGTNIHIWGNDIDVAPTTNNYLNICNTIEANLSTQKVSIQKLNLSNLPSSDTGLDLGDVWNDGGVLKIKS